MTTIAEEIERVKSIDASKMNESTAKTTMVLPILRTLGWDTTDPDEVKLEYKVAQHLRGFADIALLVQDNPLVLLETKSPQHPLGTEKREAQVLEYCQMVQVRMGVLTNGVEWRIYYLESGADKSISHAKTINLADWKTEDAAKMLAKLLSRDAITDSRALTHAKQAWHQSVLTDSWKGLLEQGDTTLVNRLRKEAREKCNINIPKNDVENFVMARANLPSAAEKTPLPPAPSIHGEKKAIPDSSQSRKPRRGRPRARIFGVESEPKAYKTIMVDFIQQACHNNEQKLEDLKRHSESYGKSFRVIRSSGKPQSNRAPNRIGETNYWLEINMSADSIKRACDGIKQALSLPEDVLVWLD